MSSNYALAPPRSAGWSYENAKNPNVTDEWLFRENYNRYLDTYQPLEDYLFQQLGDWQGKTNSAQWSAYTTANRQFDKAEEGALRNFKSLGIEMSPQEKQSLQRNYDIAAATSAVNAANNAGSQMENTRMALIGGFSPYQVG